MTSADTEWTERELRKAFRLDRDERGTLISISVRNAARPGPIRGTRMGAWGRNVRCSACRELIAWNNERGSDARKRAELSAGSHLLNTHPERVSEARAAAGELKAAHSSAEKPANERE